MTGRTDLTSKTIALGADHAGFKLKESLKQYLEENGWSVIDHGANSEASVDYPDFAHKVITSLKDGSSALGLIICGTGIGISIAANRHKEIRAALCHDATTARLSRAHNDANVLALGGRIVGVEVAIDTLHAFITTRFEGGRHADRLKKI